MSISNIGNSNILSIICDLCFLSIEDEPMVQCNICKIDLCVHCFYDRLETNLHKKNHEYRIIMCSKKTKCDWNILEELIFMNGLDKYGIGNWEFLSKSIGTKSEEEVEEFFYESFGIKHNTISTTRIDEKLSNPFRHKISIYMNHRQDFDVEYMNDYEDYIKELEYTDSDEEIDRQAKDAILKSYENIIKLRNYRKNIIINKGLIDVDKNKEFDKKMLEYVDIDKYKFLLEFLTPNQYHKFVEGIYKQNILKKLYNKQSKEIDFNYVLSKAEKLFCKKWKIPIKSFGIIKKAYVNSMLYNKTDFQEDIRTLFGNDNLTVVKILEFLNSQGYLRKSE